MFPETKVNYFSLLISLKHFSRAYLKFKWNVFDSNENLDELASKIENSNLANLNIASSTLHF